MTFGKVFGKVAVVAWAKNNGNKPARFVEVQATAYDASGKIIEVGTGFANSGDLIAPGDTAPFAILLPRSNVAVARYSLFVGGRELAITNLTET